MPDVLPSCFLCVCAVLSLPDDFQAMHSLLCLHVWLLLVRLRAEGKPGKQLAQVRGGRAMSRGRGRGRRGGCTGHGCGGA